MIADHIGDSLRAARSARRQFVRRHGLREALLLCLPAVLLAVALRAYVLWHYPVAFIHDDSAATLETANQLLSKAAFATEGKKTPLVPAVYCIPALLGVPVLGFAAALQHVLGMALVLIVGMLVRAWFVRWRVFIVPVTCIVALHPAILWYEHVALAEIYAVFAALLVALVGWGFSQSPSRWSLVALYFALLLVATARPEGHLFAFLGVALVVRAFWGQRKMCFVATGATCAWAFFLFAITQTSQGGTLLYASVVQFTPDRLFASPGLAEAVRDVRDESRSEWASNDLPGLVRIRKSLQAAIREDMVGRGTSERAANGRVNGIAKRAAIETILRNPLTMPRFAVQKFVIGHHEPLTLGFNDYALEGQITALFEDGERRKALRYTELAWGEKLTTEREAAEFFEATNTPVPGDWLQNYLMAFQKAALLPILSVSLPGSEVKGGSIHGLPALYTLAVLGIVTLAVRSPQPLGFHFLFGCFLVALFLIVMITANVRARFRITFEPFWFLYAAAFLDCAWSALRLGIDRGRHPSP